MELKVFLCEHCGIKFRNNNDLERHLSCLQTTRSRSCEEDEEQKVMYNINKAVAQKFVSKNCGKTFSGYRYWNYKMHVNAHTKERNGCEDKEKQFKLFKECEKMVLKKYQEFGNECNLASSLKEEEDKTIHGYEQFVKFSFEQKSHFKNHLNVEDETKSRKQNELNVIINTIQNIKLKGQNKTELAFPENTKDQAFKCEHCEGKFITGCDLLKHLKIHVSERKYEVKLFKEDSRKYKGETVNLHFEKDLINTEEILSQLNDQLQVPAESKPCGSEYFKKKRRHTPYECKHCGNKFKQSSHLRRHLQMHTGDKPNECKHRRKKFSQSAALKNHLRIHTGEKPYECKQCGKKFSQSATLKNHLRIHTGDKLSECKHCGNKFSRSSALKLHLRIHTGEKPYECKHCGKKFNQSGNLKVHLRIHTGDKPYECKLCGKKFSQNVNLEMHIRTHTGEKPYECKQCGKKFSQSGNFESHLRQIHAGYKPYECNHCGKKFIRNGELKKHSRTHMV